MKTSELSGIALDWAVAKAIGEYKPVPVPNYSTDWAQGGPIIEREDISFRKYHNPEAEGHGTYYAMVCRSSGSMIRWDKKTSKQGPTPLIAAMRCYVASKLGDDVEIPEELT
jgi:hypothetical protein